ncbi:MAG: DUF3667 domain-containing protein [Longimicrobiales bacterium]|nr:DUF3667 domain-containing protein [Longimicrobiales bacterium]
MPPATEERCPNCGSEVSGRFCPDCGQERSDLFPGVGAWIKEALGELLGADGKLPRSLRALAWPPGELTLEWHRGRRARYVSPLRLYLAAALLFFLAWPNTPLASALEGFATGFFAARGESESSVSEAEVELGAQVVAENLPGLMIILFVPAFAVALQVASRGAGVFATHLVVALHAHTALFACMILASPLNLLVGRGWEDVGAPAVLLGAFAFVAASIARVYRLSPLRAVLRAAAVTVGYAVVVAFCTALVLAVVVGRG